MENPTKEQVLTEAREQLVHTVDLIDTEIANAHHEIEAGMEEIRSSETEAEETKMIQGALMEHKRGRIEELGRMRPSPYFTRCDVHFDDEQHPQSLYVGRFGFSEKGIYSWTTGIAAIRFEEPGDVSYETPEDAPRTGKLLRKDQFMIVDGNIIFLSSEGIGAPRQLIHQEYLSTRKGTFALPEIVAQMEKAQDEVIRAHHAGPFVISGPAGSGKTTLALHRVAYLTQSPDTAKMYPSQGAIVLVQDAGTKDYFSHLLPELGIHDVTITTFPEWALKMLELWDFVTINRPGKTEQERDQYEYAKIKAMRARPVFTYRKGSEFSLLEGFYAPSFTERQRRMFDEQRAAKTLDRYDLTLLLTSLKNREGGLMRTRLITQWLKDGSGRMRQITQTERIEYPLMVIDEFQNYLPEQLKILGSCLKKNRSVLYVGDMAQQTRFGTIQGWEDIGEVLSDERTVKLHKVYRNTRNILEYVASLGYAIEIPEGIKRGPDVSELRVTGIDQEISYVEELLQEDPARSIGILTFDPEYLKPFSSYFEADERVRCMSVREAQGVEFDSVCLVGIGSETFALSADESLDTGYATEKQRVSRDLLYVALTRAISELHVTGRDLSVLRAS